MNEFLIWLSGSAVTLIALYVTWYIFQNSMKVAEKGPRGVLMLIVSLVLVFIGAGYVVVPALNELYVRVRNEVAQSQLAADVISVAGAVPGDFNVGPAAQSGGSITVVGSSTQSAPAITVVAPPTPPMVAADLPDVVVFPRVDNLPVVGETLTVEGMDGSIQTFAAAEVSNVAACGWFLGRLDAQMRPTYLLACPPEDLRIFAASQVNWQAAGVPQPPMIQPSPTPRLPAEVGVCWISWANSIELGRLTVEADYRSYLPAGTTWVITSPDGPNLRQPVNQEWVLSNSQYSIAYAVNGIVGAGLGGQNNGAGVTVYGTGVWPPGCQP